MGSTTKINTYNENFNIILVFGLSIAFGSSLKSVIDSFVFNTLEPMIILSLPSEKNTTRMIQLIHFISNIISFIIIILIILYTLKQYS